LHNGDWTEPSAVIEQHKGKCPKCKHKLNLYHAGVYVNSQLFNIINGDRPEPKKMPATTSPNLYQYKKPSNQELQHEAGVHIWRFIKKDVWRCSVCGETATSQQIKQEQEKQQK